MVLPIQEFGSGSPVVVLNGSGCPLEHCLPFARALGASHRVLVPVFPGYAGTAAHRGDYSFEIERGWLQESLQPLVKKDPVALVGFSLGGYRALSLAVGGALEVSAVVSLAGFANVSADERGTFVAFAGMARTRQIPAGILSSRYLSAPYSAAHPAVAKEVDSWLQIMNFDALAMEFDAIAASADLRAGLGRLKVPVLARVGDLDLAVPQPHSLEIVKSVQSGRLEVAAGSGHLLLTEDFDKTLASVRAALSSANRTQPSQ